MGELQDLIQLEGEIAHWKRQAEAAAANAALFQQDCALHVAEKAELRAALKPFAAMVNSEYDDVPNVVGVLFSFDNGEELGAVPFGDFRRASRALAAKEHAA